MGTLIVLAGMVAFVLWVYFYGPRTQPKQSSKKGGGFMEPREMIVVGEDFTDFENPYASTEKSLVVKRDRALEKAAKQARLTWKDRKELRKSTSKNLLEITQQTSEDLKDAIVSKFRSDLNYFVTAHKMRNMANLERLKMAFETALTQAYAESCNDRMNAKMKVLLSAIERMERKAEELRTFHGSNGHARLVIESFERLFQKTIREIESINVRMSQSYFNRE